MRQGWVTPPVLGGAQPPPRKPVAAFRDLMSELAGDR